MILYKAVIRKNAVDFIEFNVDSESKCYYTIKSNGQPKRVKKEAKHSFASLTKKQAVLTFLKQLEGLKFMHYNPNIGLTELSKYLLNKWLKNENI
jgi:hypothetical protein